MIENKRLFYGLGAVFLFVILFELWVFLGHGHLWPIRWYPTDEVIGPPVIIKQTGGNALLISECGNKPYLNASADYIIEGTVKSVESRWDEGKNSVLTYTGLSIVKYIKGTPFEVSTGEKFKRVTSELLVITPGGCVGVVCQAAEDQPLFHENKSVKVYFKRTTEGFSVVCGRFGVEEI